MLTVRHIERLWNTGRYTRLLDELIAPRIEALAIFDLGSEPEAAAAALALIRLDELNQPHAALCPRLIRAIVTAQQSDGGWTEVMTTSLCLRALTLQHGDGRAIRRGMQYLADLQQSSGIWPKIPLRRMPADPMASAFVLLQLGDNELFRATARFYDAMNWFGVNSLAGEAAASTMWDHARVRCATPETLFPATATAPTTWS